VTLLALATTGVAIAANGGLPLDFKDGATKVCERAQREAEGLPQSPGSIGEALELERAGLAVYERELFRLRVLGPLASPSFRAGVADDRALMSMLSSMLARPDFVRLSLTLPNHPGLAPRWLKDWLARSRALVRDAKARFAEAGVAACEKSLG
jgi:hypothetical protein